MQSQHPPRRCQSTHTTSIAQPGTSVEGCSRILLLPFPPLSSAFTLHLLLPTSVYYGPLLTAAVKWRVRGIGTQPMEVGLIQEAQVVVKGIQSLSRLQRRHWAQRLPASISVDAPVGNMPATSAPSLHPGRGFRGATSLTFGNVSRFVRVALELWWRALSGRRGVVLTTKVRAHSKQK